MAKTLLSLSLSGGQGKTLTTYMIGVMATRLSLPTLLIDADPQRNLTDLLNVEVQPNEPTLLEVIKGDVAIDDAIYPVPGRESLYLVPADRALVNAQYYLSSLPNSSFILKKRLQPVLKDFEIIGIDTPPQKSHIVLTAIGASDSVVVPAEVAAKGVGSLAESLALLDECQEMNAFAGELIGVLPFRARWVGLAPTTETRTNLAAMEEIAGDKLLPPLQESEVYKRSLNLGRSPAELDQAKAGLEYPFEVLFERLGLGVRV